MTDLRTLFATDRVAHESLRGVLDRPAYSVGTPGRICVPVANLYDSDSGRGPARQALLGHAVTLLDRSGDMQFLRDETNGYVGYVNAKAVTQDAPTPTHRVHARASFLFSDANFKAPHPAAISCGSHLAIVARDGRFARTHDGAFAIAAHLSPLSEPVADPVRVAEALIGTPYLWGGDSAFGIDCSGLVRCALMAAGLPCPGDSDQQEAQLGRNLDADSPAQRGDLYFWRGHVALAVDATMLIHANVHHMAVAYEPIADAIHRIYAQGDGPVRRRARLSSGDTS